MKKLGLVVEKIKAVFISHEHTDHISGLQVLAKKYRLPVYLTPSTYNFSGLKLDKSLVFYFNAHQTVMIGGLSVTAFPKFHDAADPYSFVISCNKINVGVFTDIGTACENIVHHFKNCHAAFLEANYDDEMLEKGRYPVFLKNRIRGNNGHLSNAQALQLFTSHRPSFMTHLFLSHLSKNNNCPELVYRLFNENAAGVKVVIASRSEETPLYYINEMDMPIQTNCTPASQLSFSFA
jgi:phosphoribosyl 1,2-cyclic phosphodiesterase